MKNFVLVAALCCSLAACGMSESTIPGNTSVACSSKSDCDSKWSKAIAWTVENGPFRIQVQTDNLIQTYGPDNTWRSAILINRETNEDGTGSIIFHSACGNEFECKPPGYTLQAEFYYALVGK